MFNTINASTLVISKEMISKLPKREISSSVLSAPFPQAFSPCFIVDTMRASRMRNLKFNSLLFSDRCTYAHSIKMNIQRIE